MIDGILLVDKKVNMSSYDVIRRLKKFLPKGQKVGHAGTLDPFASGLLIILLGKCTKLMPKFLLLRKEYIIWAEFGYETSTQDKEGKIIRRSKKINKIPEKLIESTIKEKFIGEIEQIPPVFSAKKIKGERAYHLARKGEKVNLHPRKIKVFKFKIVKYKWPYIQFQIECSSGTYVRTLIHDLARNLDTFATAIELRRIRIGDFDVESSVSVDDFSPHILGSIIPMSNLKNILNNER